MHNEEILSRLMRKQEYADKLKANMNRKLGQKSSGNLLGLGLSQQSVKSLNNTTSNDLTAFITKLGPLQRVRSNPVIDLENDGHSTGRSTASNHNRMQGVYSAKSAHSLTGSSGHEGDEDKVSYDLWLETWKYNQLAKDLKGKKPSLVPTSDAVAKMLSKQVYIYILHTHVYILLFYYVHSSSS